LAIVASRFNLDIVDRLVEGARSACGEMGLDNVPVIRVPGAFEIPVAAARLAATGRFDGLLALGCVIRGETAHFEYICREAAAGIGRVAVDFKIPVGFGLLTVENDEQAFARAGAGPENKGAESARAVVETIRALEDF
jgi:6,7-dimethyl-8-ribityllumazine synthase